MNTKQERALVAEGTSVKMTQNSNEKMVKINLKLFIVVLVFLSVSCGGENWPVSYFKIINQSSQDIKIKIPNYIDTTFYIPQNQQIEFMYSKSGEGTEPFGFTDSVFVIFNNKDTILYTWDDTSPRNILRRKNYKERVEGKNKRRCCTIYHCSYTFTEADYQNAVNGKKE